MTCPGPENADRCDNRACRYGGCQGRMPNRYEARPRLAEVYDDSYGGTAHTANEIILPVDGDDWIDSGLLDASGRRLWRRRERNRVGFLT